MIHKFRIIIFVGVSLILSNCQITLDDCDRITQAAWLEIEIQIDEKGLDGEAIQFIVFNKNEEMKKLYPSCFKAEILSTSTTLKPGVKLDSKGLKDEEILGIDKRYQIAENQCKKELENAFENISQDELLVIIHDCTMDKIVSNNLTN